MRVLWIVSLCLILLFAGTACQHTPAETPVGGAEQSTTTTNPSDGGIGGDLDDCEVHQFYYHALSGNWTEEQFDTFREAHKNNGGSQEDFNIISFVRCLEITREDFIEVVDWEGNAYWEGDLDKPALAHYKDCPYTYNQFLDAIYGDDPDLTEWVFSYETVRGLPAF